MEKLKKTIRSIYHDDLQLNLNEYNSLIYHCVSNYEMAAVIFLYDNMKKKNIKPDSHTFNLINKLHSKKCPENNIIVIPNQNVGKLNPRRRIHKIMKGHNYSENYQNALQHLEKVKKYISENPDVKYYSRIKLAKHLSKNCDISFNNARYIITNLKKTKFLKIDTPKISDFTNVEKFLEAERKSRPLVQQTRISDFFNKY
jgi:pentatricopeptide repeat protein